jgi:hypothetical protein
MKSTWILAAAIIIAGGPGCGSDTEEGNRLTPAPPRHALAGVLRGFSR